MQPKGFRKYLVNCFLLTLPIMLWNITLATKLPSAFQPDTFGKNIPAFVTYGEYIFRTLVFLLALLCP